MRKFHLPLSLGLAAQLLPLAGSADDASVRINPIVVTPTLTARTVDDSLSSVTVIDRENLDKQQPRELSEVLRGQPGVDLTTSGPYGKNTSVFMRGTGAESTVLLLDGIRMESATAGAPAWQFLPPQLLDRVEIVRGPRSSIYGSDAVGGVVQAFSPEGEGDPRPWVQAGGGSYRAREYGAGVSGSQGGTAYSFGHNYFQTDGIALRRGGDRKGFRNASAMGRMSHAFDGGVRLGLTAFRSEGNTEFDGGDTDYVNQALGVSIDVPVTTFWLSRLSVSESRDDADTDDEFGSSRFDTRHTESRWQNILLLGRHELVVGGDFRRARVDSTTEFEESRRDNTGAFAQLFLDAGPADFQFSLRWDDNDAFGEEVTGAAVVGYALDDVHRVRLSYGTAFRAPTFNDLYFPGFSNPDLDPERSRTAELGVSARRQTWFWDLAAYQTEVKQLIVFDNVAFRPENVDEARIRGAELGAGALLGAWTVYGALTVTDPRDRRTDNRLPRRTTRSARLELDRRFGEWSLGATGILQGDRYDDAANDRRLSGFGLLNLRAGWEFAPDWSARLTVDNMLDKDYAVAQFFDGEPFRQPGRNAFLSIRYGHR